MPQFSARDSDSSSAFVTVGFCNWKKALERFAKHESSALHKFAVKFNICSARGHNVVAQLDTQKQRDMQSNRVALLKILSSLQYLAMQGLAIRRLTDAESNLQRLLLSFESRMCF